MTFITEQCESIKDLGYTTEQIYIRIHRELTDIWLLARRNKLSGFVVINAEIQVKAREWLVSLDDATAGIEDLLKDADSFLDGIVNVYGGGA